MVYFSVHTMQPLGMCLPVKKCSAGLAASATQLASSVSKLAAEEVSAEKEKGNDICNHGNLFCLFE